MRGERLERAVVQSREMESNGYVVASESKQDAVFKYNDDKEVTG